MAGKRIQASRLIEFQVSILKENISHLDDHMKAESSRKIDILKNNK